MEFFTNQIHGLNDEFENEKLLHKHQLTKIVKSLLRVEAKIKSDQTIIKSELYEKDDEINRLYQEICFLKNKYDDKTNINIYEISKFCPNCRQQYYLAKREIHNNSTFVKKDNGSPKKKGELYL